jgi:hypothetical protein
MIELRNKTLDLEVDVTRPVLSSSLNEDIRDQDDVYKMLETGENLETCLTWFPEDPNITSMASRNRRF